MFAQCIPDEDELIMQNMRKNLTEEGKTEWMCCVCGRSGNHKNSIKAHVQTHLNLEQNCVVCGKASKNKEALRCHMKLYHKNGGQVPYC